MLRSVPWESCFYALFLCFALYSVVTLRFIRNFDVILFSRVCSALARIDANRLVTVKLVAEEVVLSYYRERGKKVNRNEKKAAN